VRKLLTCFLALSLAFPSVASADKFDKAIVYGQKSDGAWQPLLVGNDGTVQTSGGGSASSILSPKTPNSSAATSAPDGKIGLISVAGVGGDTSVSTTGNGGAGGNNYLIAGLGGSANSANTASTGGRGGKNIIQAGDGGSAVVASGTNLGGAGGDNWIYAGAGGAAANGSGNTNGVGGNNYIEGGRGITTGGNNYIIPGKGGTTNGNNYFNYDIQSGVRRGLFVVGAGTSSATNYLYEYTINSNSANWEFNLSNKNSGNASVQRLSWNNDGTESQYHPYLSSYSSGHTGTVFGITLANYFSILGTGSSYNGMLIGNTTAKPIVLGTNNAENLRIASGGHIETKGTAPSIASGFGTSPSIVGNDNNGQVTVGTGGSATTGTINFASTWANAPMCVANHQGAILPVRAVATTTQLTIDASSAFTASGVIDFQCRGRN
jgi:hypothetical protein